MTIENRFPTLETARLLLREIVPTDSNALFAIHGDVEHMRWFGADAPATVEDAAKLIDIFAGWRNLPNPGTRWGIERQSDGVFIGTCGLFKWNKGWSSCTIGYELALRRRDVAICKKHYSLSWLMALMKWTYIVSMHPFPQKTFVQSMS